MAAHRRAAAFAAKEIASWLKDLSLCDCFELAGSSMLLPPTQAIGRALKHQIKKKGAARLFAPASRVLCYSGPRKSIKRALRALGIPPNHARAIDLASHKLYTLLERTPMGVRLENYIKKEPDPLKRSLYGCLESIYVKEKTDPKILEEQRKTAQEQGDLLMGFVSAAYIFTAKGHVETVVSGADFQKVFYLFELPALMLNPDIQTINGVAVERFRKVYFSGKPDAAYQTYRMICESEVALFEKRAKFAGKRTVFWQQWKAQKTLQKADRVQFKAVRVFRGILSQKTACAASAPV